MSDAHKYNFVCAGLRRFTIVGSDTKITLKVFLFYGKPAASVLTIFIPTASDSQNVKCA